MGDQMLDPSDQANMYEDRFQAVINMLERDALLRRKLNRMRLMTAMVFTTIIIALAVVFEVGKNYFNIGNAYQQIIQPLIATSFAITGSILGYFYGKTNSENIETELARTFVYKTLREAISLREDAIDLNRFNRHNAR